MSKVIEIKECKHCGYYYCGQYSERCLHTQFNNGFNSGKQLLNVTVIPTWCPLPDKENKNE